MERVCGLIQPLARSKLYLDESISNALSYQIYLDVIPFARCLTSEQDINIDDDSMNSDLKIDSAYRLSEDDEEDSDMESVASDISDNSTASATRSISPELFRDDYRIGLGGNYTKAHSVCDAGMLFQAQLVEELD
jgi:hypothetical protein